MRDPADQRREFAGTWRTGAVQPRFALRLRVVRRVHPVQPQHVEMHVEIERAAEALDQRDRTAARVGPLDARLIRQPAADDPLHDAQHRADHLRLAGEQQAQGKRNAQHPLPHRPRAEHLFHQVPRTLGHAPRAATRTEPAMLAGERHQPLGMALLAHHPQEAVLQYPTVQVRLELLAHVGR